MAHLITIIKAGFLCPLSSVICIITQFLLFGKEN